MKSCLHYKEQHAQYANIILDIPPMALDKVVLAKDPFHVTLRQL